MIIFLADMLTKAHLLSPNNYVRIHNFLRTDGLTDRGAYTASQKLRKNNKLASAECSIIERQHAEMKDMPAQIRPQKKEPTGEYPSVPH